MVVKLRSVIVLIRFFDIVFFAKQKREGEGEGAGGGGGTVR